MTEFTLPTTEQIELMAPRDLIMNYNHFAPTAGQNPVKKFQDRPTGIKRLTAVAEALRSKGVTEAAPTTEFPLIVRPTTEDVQADVDAKIEAGNPIVSHFDPATATEAELLANGFVELTPVPEPVTPKAKKSKTAPKMTSAENTAMFQRVAKNSAKVELNGDAEPKAKKAAVKTASGKPNLSARLREEIGNGLTNDAVWAIIQPEFNLDDNKKGYVAGQRRAMAK